MISKRGSLNGARGVCIWWGIGASRTIDDADIGPPWQSPESTCRAAHSCDLYHDCRYVDGETQRAPPASTAWQAEGHPGLRSCRESSWPKTTTTCAVFSARRCR